MNWLSGEIAKRVVMVRVNTTLRILFFSTPAPGYFDDDDVLDFMVHWCVGAWPDYTSSNVS